MVPISDAADPVRTMLRRRIYVLFSPILEGVDESGYALRLRSRDGSERDYRVELGEQSMSARLPDGSAFRSV